MAAARMLLQNLPHSLRRQILSPSAVNRVALGSTVLNDKPSVGGDHLSGPSRSSSLWLQQTVNRQSPAFKLSPSVKNSDSEAEIEVSDSEWGDEFEDEGSDESDPDDFYNSDEEKYTDRVPKLEKKYLKDW